MENSRENKKNRNAEQNEYFEVEEVGRKNSVNWNHSDSILNWNQRKSYSTHVDPSYNDSNQPIPDNSTKFGSIHDSDNIREIEMILVSMLHSLVYASSIFTYGSKIDPPFPPCE